jgi:hypothetical protein
MYRVAAAIALFSSVTLSAQNQSSQPEVMVPPNLPANVTFAGGCPISMDAKQGLWDHTIQIRNGQKEPYNGFGQRISLTLVDIHTEPIIAAKVKVLGLSGHNRMLNTRQDSQPDASRIIKLTSFSEVKGGVMAELYVPGFTSVTSIQLLEIIYANGSTWSSPHSSVCRVAPDPLMLVAAH